MAPGRVASTSRGSAVCGAPTIHSCLYLSIGKHGQTQTSLCVLAGQGLSTVTLMDSDVPKINPSGLDLVYMVIADYYAEKITSGELSYGDRIPGELDIAATFGVARMTVSRAVRELRERGLVRTVRGKGTFVVDTPGEDTRNP